ncbi:tRNA lysidine(34) synthetase TilS [bacterium]|nr:tRNA lysidine(34) synthetase TilS [bacterium]
MTTNPTRKKVARSIEEHGLFTAGDTVIAAVSGGADSVALLDILASLEYLRLKLVVAHLNHGLRGAESDGDAAFVAELARRYDLPFESETVDVREIGRVRGLSLEEAGRAARYEWFDELADKHGARRVALGHHADDQAETFLLRLLRGAGTTGLRGMRPLAAGRYVRPLLGLSRAEIVAYLELRRISWRNDSSNGNTDFLRNRIRHECLPYLASYNPAITERLNSAAEILAADETVLENLTDQVFGRLCAQDSSDVVLNIPRARVELPGVRFRLYRRAVLVLKGDLARISGSHLKQIDDLLMSARVNGGLSLPGGLRVWRSYGTLHFSLPVLEPGAWTGEVLIDGPGRYRLPCGGSMTVRLTSPPAGWKGVPVFRAYFDPARTPFPWAVRTFRPGDRFHPFGMKGHKKVKDFFIDAKVPAALRRNLPLLFRGEELLWVCGLRVAEAGRIRPGTREVVEVEIPDITT